MAYLDDIQLWAFGGHSAARLLGSPTQWEEWFDEESMLSVEPILDSSDRYVDVGGTTMSPLQLILAFVDDDARAAFMALRGQAHTLSRPGRSRQAVLRRTQPIASGHNGFVLLGCTFEAL